MPEVDTVIPKNCIYSSTEKNDWTTILDVSLYNIFSSKQGTVASLTHINFIKTLKKIYIKQGSSAV